MFCACKASAQLKDVGERDDDRKVDADVEAAAVPEDAGHQLEPEALVAVAVEHVLMRQRDIEPLEQAAGADRAAAADRQRALDVLLGRSAQKDVGGERADRRAGGRDVDLRHRPEVTDGGLEAGDAEADGLLSNFRGSLHSAQRGEREFRAVEPVLGEAVGLGVEGVDDEGQHRDGRHRDDEERLGVPAAAQAAARAAPAAAASRR